MATPFCRRWTHDPLPCDRAIMRVPPKPSTWAPGDRSLSERARAALAFAVKAHGDQRYGDQPYVVHLEAVVAIASEFGFSSDDALAVAALHDVLEDTSADAAEIEARFGAPVREAVEQLSRKDSMSESRYLAGMNALAFAVKLADRMANLRALGTAKGEVELERHRRKLLPKYRGEDAHFRRRAEQLGGAHLAAYAQLSSELARAAERLGVAT
jgi:guanosine-3',5'-bis(diphosphate) 3'-pyrophosphohydrolase